MISAESVDVYDAFWVFSEQNNAEILAFVTYAVPWEATALPLSYTRADQVITRRYAAQKRSRPSGLDTT